MINSNKRKLSLSGWLMENGREEYNSGLKLQKFLLFYESFSKLEGESYDFSHLKGYKRGPVFGNVLGDYTHDREEFDEAAHEAYLKFGNSVNTDRAIKSRFIVGIMSEKELSSLTHEMNIWKSKEARIMNGEQHVDLSERDFNKSDENLINLLSEMYPMDLIKTSKVIEIDSHYFIFNKEDVRRLTAQHYDVLSALVESEELFNPIYVEIDDEGRLVVD